MFYFKSLVFILLYKLTNSQINFRSCVPMSRTVARSFDTTGVTMCTFNCDDNVADIVFIPCGHRVVCATCAVSTLLRRCPLCYQQIIVAKNSCIIVKCNFSILQIFYYYWIKKAIRII